MCPKNQAILVLLWEIPKLTHKSRQLFGTRELIEASLPCTLVYSWMSYGRTHRFRSLGTKIVTETREKRNMIFWLGTLALGSSDETLQAWRVKAILSLNTRIVLPLIRSHCFSFRVVIDSRNFLAFWIIYVVFPEWRHLKICHTAPSQWEYCLLLWQKLMVSDVRCITIKVLIRTWDWKAALGLWFLGLIPE